MVGEFQDQGLIDQYLEEWLYPKGSQSFHGFFSKEEKHESIRIEDSSPEGKIITNQDPQGEITTMLVVN